MAASFEDKSANQSGPRSGRLAVLLAAVLLVNFVLLGLPLVMGSSGPAAVAATSAAPSLPAGSPQPRPSAQQVKTAVLASQPTGQTIELGSAQPPIAVTTAAGPDGAVPVAEDALAASPPDPAPTTAASPIQGWTAPQPMPDFDPSVLEIVNPLANNGPVHFLLDGNVCTLRPGERQFFSTSGDHPIEFHRGDDFGDEFQVIERGTWCFRVGSRGWELLAAEHVPLAGDWTGDE